MVKLMVYAQFTWCYPPGVTPVHWRKLLPAGHRTTEPVAELLPGGRPVAAVGTAARRPCPASTRRGQRRGDGGSPPKPGAGRGPKRGERRGGWMRGSMRLDMMGL